MPLTFLERYADSWTAILQNQDTAEALDKFFHVPCHMFQADGSLFAADTSEAVRDFNEGRLASFRAGGVTHARTAGSEIAEMGEHVAMLTADWELLRDDGSIERSWRHHYTLRKTDGDWRILVSVLQPGS